MQNTNNSLYTNKHNEQSIQLSKPSADTQENKLIDKKALERESLNRSKKLPFIQKVQKKLSKEEKPFSELIFNSGAIEKRMVLLNDGILNKFNIERKGDRMK